MTNVKVGIIGFGSIGERHYKNLLSLGISDITMLSKRKDVPAATLRTMVAFTKAGPFDFIFICNETYKHLATIKAVLPLKPKAIFVEKPLAMTATEVRKIQLLIAKKPVHFFVGYSRQFYAPYVRLKEVVEKGLLGKIFSVRISVGQDLTEWRKRDYRASYSSKKKEGGGVILDLVHEINFPGWLLNESMTISSAVVRKVSALRKDTEDLVEAIGVSKKGTVVSIHLDCVRKPARWSAEIIGEKGSVTWDSESKKISLRGGSSSDEVIEVIWNEMFVKETEFFLGLLNQKTKFSNIKEALADAECIDRIKRYEK